MELVQLLHLLTMAGDTWSDLVSVLPFRCARQVLTVTPTGAVPAIFLACLLPFCPESPRQLVYRGRLEEAEQVLLKLYNGATVEQVRAKVALIAAACEEARETERERESVVKDQAIAHQPSQLPSTRVCLWPYGHLANVRLQHFDVLLVDPFRTGRLL